MQMKWDDSGWYKWNESEMKYISQVKELEEDIVFKNVYTNVCFEYAPARWHRNY